MTIQEIKEKEGQNAKFIIVSGLGLEGKGGNYKCPNSSHHKSGDKNPSMGWHEEGLQFHCFTCGHRIDLYSYYVDYKGMTHAEVMEMYSEDLKPLKKPLTQYDELTVDMIDYLKTRLLTEETIKAFNVKSYKGMIAFVYNTGGAKLRAVGKVEKNKRYQSVKGSEFTFYNMERTTGKGTLYITEGEIDCMVVGQCGYNNVVSVGTGASSKGIILKHKAFIEQYDAIVLLSDNDTAGNEMDKFFLETFGIKAKTVDKSYYKNHSDINALYFKEGKQGIKMLIDSAQEKIQGIYTSKDYQNARDRVTHFIPTGFDKIDYALNDLQSRFVTVITGKTGHGKSAYAHQIILKALEKREKVLLVDGEHHRDFIFNKLFMKLLGGKPELVNKIKYNKDYIIEPKSHIRAEVDDFLSPLKIYKPASKEHDYLMKLFQVLVHIIRVDKVKLLMVDNLMSIAENNDDNKFDMQGEFIEMCHKLAEEENVHIVVIAHRKKGTSFDPDEISGNSNISKFAQTIINVERLDEDSKEAQEKNITGKVRITKNRYNGILAVCETGFDVESQLLVEVENRTPKPFNINYNKATQTVMSEWISNDFVTVDPNDDNPF